MAKITRVLQKIFGDSAATDRMGVFGSLKAGSPATSKDMGDIQSLSNFLGGWDDAVMGNNSPALEEMNSLHYLFSKQLAYLFQSGIAEWEAATTYYIGSFCVRSGSLFYSLTDDNVGNDPASNLVNWAAAGGVGSGVILPFGADISKIPPGYLYCDGSAVSRTVYARLYDAIGTTWGPGDGFSTFNVPPLKNRFLRGAGAATDTFGGVSVSLGAYQADKTAKNGLSLSDPGHNHSSPDGKSFFTAIGIGVAAGGGAVGGGVSAGLQATTTTNATGITLSGDSETNPKAYGAHFIIKF